MDGVNQALEATKTFGVVVVALFAMGIFLGWLIIYVLKSGERREERLSAIVDTNLLRVEKSFIDYTKRTDDAMKAIEQADKYQREEHERMIDTLDEISRRLMVKDQ